MRRDNIDPGRERGRALSALHSIDPGLPRDDWHAAGRAAIAAGLTVDDVVAWSSSAGNFSGEKDVRAAFRSIKPDGGTGPGTLFKMAREAGWTDVDQRAPARAPARPRTAKPQPAKPHQLATAVWERFPPAPADHPYILAKHGRPDGLRLVPEGDSLRIAGRSVVGDLVVPVVPVGGQGPVSLQFIPPPGAGKKLNLPGAPVEGAFIVGDLSPGCLAYLVEGLGQAWACWQATGRPAVVCFGWGNVARVAAELKARQPDVCLVVVPDAGKEHDADCLAEELRIGVAKMPEGSPNNFDANDYAQAHGPDALDVLLGEASMPAPPEPHPLARFIDLDARPKPPRWVIPGFIGHGLALIAGAHGAGKTTALLPLALVAAGLHPPGDPLAPLHWRRVVYIAEDTEQVGRILAGLLNHAQHRLDVDLVRDRLRVVEARRMPVSEVVKAAGDYKPLRRDVGGVELLPLVVFDTKSAILSLDEENSNSEASAAIATLRQSFDGMPVWLVAHVAKASLSRGDAAGLSVRGAGAWEADANQVLYLVTEGEARYLVRGKTRFEAKWPELLIRSYCAHTDAPNEFGGQEAVTLRWSHPEPTQVPLTEARAQAQEQARKDAEADLRDDIRNAVQVAWQQGNPLNRERLKAAVPRKRNEVHDAMVRLITEQWLIEVDVPPELRTHPRRSTFLVNLTTQQHDAVMAGQPLPPDLLEVPASWRKDFVSSVPERGRLKSETEGGGHAE